jgi:hypothetical protein
MKFWVILSTRQQTHKILQWLIQQYYTLNHKVSELHRINFGGLYHANTQGAKCYYTLNDSCSYNSARKLRCSTGSSSPLIMNKQTLQSFRLAGSNHKTTQCHNFKGLKHQQQRCENAIFWQLTPPQVSGVATKSWSVQLKESCLSVMAR